MRENPSSWLSVYPGVFGTAHLLEVLSTIVERIVVDVMHLIARTGFHDHAMEIHAAALLMPADITVKVDLPFSFIQPINILGTDEDSIRRMTRPLHANSPSFPSSSMALPA
jgi:hypothetical protein